MLPPLLLPLAGLFTAAMNNLSYGMCNSLELGPKLQWFCFSKLLQFLFTIVVPFILLMVWQNAFVPATLYK